MANSFEEDYPNIARWVKDYDGLIEIGYDGFSDSFVRALDEGGLIWEGKESYENLDEAFQALEKGVAEAIKKIYG